VFGNMGIGELLITILIILPLYVLPIAFIVWLVRRMLRRRSEVDELRARVAALEGKQDPRDGVS
jgi:hypothetical protein